MRPYYKTKEKLPNNNFPIQWITDLGDVIEGFYIDGEWFEGKYKESISKINYIPEYWIERGE